MQVFHLPTPSLMVDLDVLEQNQSHACLLLSGAPQAALWPHYKSHKSTALAHLQLECGAKGITCATIGEAEDLAHAGVEDIVLANVLADPDKRLRAASLAACCRLTVCLDRAEEAAALEAACAVRDSELGVYVEYDVGMGRCGVRTPEEAVAAAQAVAAQPHLFFAGVQAYAGHLAHMESGDARARESARIESRLRALLGVLRAAGFDGCEVAGASTGTIALRGADTVYTQVQAGTYLLMDAAYARAGAPFSQALFVVSTVLSAFDGGYVCDVGTKRLGMDQGPPLLAAAPQARLSVNEEHTVVTGAPAKQPGDKALLIPGHCCTSVNLAPALYLTRGSRVVDCVPVTSRGR